MDPLSCRSMFRQFLQLQNELQLIPDEKHSQYFFWHWLFWQLQTFSGTIWSRFLKQFGTRSFASSLARSMPLVFDVVFEQPSQMQFLPQTTPRVKHSQYSFKQPIFLHLQPVRDFSPRERLSFMSSVVPEWPIECCTTDLLADP